MTQQNLKIRVDQIQTAGEGTGGWGMLKVWEDQFAKVRQVVDSMRPKQVDTGATTYNNLGKRMNESVELIYKQAQRLVEAWGGEDAEKAMNQMNKAYRQAREIETKSTATSKALSAHAQQQRSWQQSYGSGTAHDSWVKDVVSWGTRAMAINPATAPTAIGGLIGNNWGASDVMDAINNGTKDSNNNFPTEIRQDVPTTNILDQDPKAPTSPTNPAAPGSPKMPGTGPGNGPGPGDIPKGPDGPTLPNGPNGPGGPGGSGPQLPEAPTPPGSGPSLPEGPGGPGSGLPGIGNGPGGTDLANLPGPGGGPGLGGGGGGLPGGMPGGGGLPTGTPGGGPSALGTGPGSIGGGLLGGPGLGRNGLAAGGMGGMGMPMGVGGGGGRDGEERERSTWLTEDEDVWGGNDEAAPPVIG